MIFESFEICEFIRKLWRRE